MYSTCLFCNQNLGTNEIVETLPVGRRLAFDGAQGRLWVVCRGCERWNLVPFDTRLETIEACERLFRSTRLRYSTDNIGIARLPEGLELVRVGPAQRPEFAAWRYGDQFGRRYRRAWMYGSIPIVGIAGVYALGAAAGLSVAMFGSWMGQIPNLYNLYRGAKVIGRVPVGGETRAAITQGAAPAGRLERSAEGELQLRVDVRKGTFGRFVRLGDRASSKAVWRGQEVMDALRYILPALNADGGSKKTVQSAVELVGTGTPEQLLTSGSTGNWKHDKNGKFLLLGGIKGPHRLALEMTLHEDSERIALAGELKLLERQWREAEEIAAIADSLALPESSDSALDALRKKDS